MCFKDWLRYERRRCGLTQRELARRAGFDKESIVANIENGMRRASPEDIRRLEVALQAEYHGEDKAQEYQVYPIPVQP